MDGHTSENVDRHTYCSIGGNRAQSTLIISIGSRKKLLRFEQLGFVKEFKIPLVILLRCLSSDHLVARFTLYNPIDACLLRQNLIGTYHLLQGKKREASESHFYIRIWKCPSEIGSGHDWKI